VNSVSDTLLIMDRVKDNKPFAPAHERDHNKIN